MRTNKKRLYRVFLWIALLASLALLWRLTPVLTNPLITPIDDFVRHWAAGRLIITGGNPYSTAQIQVLQDQATQNKAIVPVITPNYVPPWVMLLLAVFGIPDYVISRVLWLLFNAIIILISAEFLWRVYAKPVNKKWITFIACLVFAPTISVLEKGQTTCLALLGLAGFLFFIEKRNNPWLAGAFACLVTVKPQLLYLFWVPFLIWTLHHRDFRLLIGFAATFVLGTGLAMILDPGVVSEYIQAILSNSPTMYQTPTIGGYIRYFITGPGQFWPQFIALPFGIAWVLYDYWTHRRQWIWSERLPWLVFVSLLTSFYSWTYDQVLLVLPVAQAWFWLEGFIKKTTLWILAAIFFTITIINLIQHRFADEFWFIWFLPAVLVWYILVFRQARSMAPASAVQA